jgi:hypothetical protein
MQVIFTEEEYKEHLGLKAEIKRLQEELEGKREETFIKQGEILLKTVNHDGRGNPFVIYSRFDKNDPLISKYVINNKNTKLVNENKTEQEV